MSLCSSDNHYTTAPYARRDMQYLKNKEICEEEQIELFKHEA